MNLCLLLLKCNSFFFAIKFPINLPAFYVCCETTNQKPQNLCFGNKYSNIIIY